MYCRIFYAASVKTTDGVVKTLHLLRCTPRALEVYAYLLRGATNFYHYDVLWYSEIIEILSASYMKFFTYPSVIL
jgi:hypothetical protein